VILAVSSVITTPSTPLPADTRSTLDQLNLTCPWNKFFSHTNVVITNHNYLLLIVVPVHPNSTPLDKCDSVYCQGILWPLTARLPHHLWSVNIKLTPTSVSRLPQWNTAGARRRIKQNSNCIHQLRLESISYSDSSDDSKSSRILHH